MPATSAPRAEPEVEALGDGVVDRLDAHAEPAATGLMELLELRDDRLDRGRGRCEADADRAAGRREDRGIDADHLALQVEQRAAGIALVDRGVGLQEIVVGAAVDVAVAGGDDARGHGLAEAERIADRHHAVADPRLVAVAELDGLQRLVALDLQHRDVDLGILADHLGLELAAVVEDDDDVVGVADDVVVGDNDAAGVDDEAGAERLRLLRARARRDAVVLEELLEHLVERRALGKVRHRAAALLLDRLGGRDVDHRVGDLVDEIGEIGRPRLGEGGARRRKRERAGDQRRGERGRERRSDARRAASNPRVMGHVISSKASNDPARAGLAG